MNVNNFFRSLLFTGLLLVAQSGAAAFITTLSLSNPSDMDISATSVV